MRGDDFDRGLFLIISSLSLERTCNKGCNCNVEIFQPVCLQAEFPAKNSSFISPCYAGCSVKSTQRNATVYSDCKCGQKATVSPGFCLQTCYKVYLYMALLAVIMFIVSMSTVGNLIIDLRLIRAMTKELISAIFLISVSFCFFLFLSVSLFVFVCVCVCVCVCVFAGGKWPIAGAWRSEIRRCRWVSSRRWPVCSVSCPIPSSSAPSSTRPASCGKSPTVREAPAGSTPTISSATSSTASHRPFWSWPASLKPSPITSSET